MDVLQLIKDGHQKVREAIRSAQKAEKLNQISKLSESLAALVAVHLRVESSFLYPELADLFAGAEDCVTRGTRQHDLVHRELTKLMKCLRESETDGIELREKLAALADVIEAHFVATETVLMPKLRRHMSTGEREALAEVLLDVMEEEARPRSKGAAQRMAY